MNIKSFYSNDIKNNYDNITEVFPYMEVYLLTTIVLLQPSFFKDKCKNFFLL